MQKLSEGSSQENRHERLSDNAGKDAEAMGGDRMGTGGAREGGAYIRFVRSNAGPMGDM